MKNLLTVTALIEAGAGLALLICPSLIILLLFASPLDIPALLTLGRVTGSALLALGVACWLGRYNIESSAAKGLVFAMLLYNLGVAVILAAAGIVSQPVGILLWPAVVLHSAMAVWCNAILRCKH
jgi:hypothetical protein